MALLQVLTEFMAWAQRLDSDNPADLQQQQEIARMDQRQLADLPLAPSGHASFQAEPPAAAMTTPQLLLCA
ncbi:hypothetical protein [Rhizobium sp. FY34]|uniref:hypothetical protein n=1 Tax=Rhizobium sp. FY34 TaxID=2562309 RepID=UPI0010C0AFEA|nr:hypothetical protein [Rhizobium sp. FY34]